MPWSVETSVESARLNGATVNRTQFAERLSKCASCEFRQGKDCLKSGKSVEVVCKYPPFACPVGQFDKLSEKRQFPVAKSPPQACRPNTSNIITGTTEIPSGVRTSHSCDVVIAYHNDVQWLAEAIESVRRQNFVTAHIHCVHDCSPSDDTEVRKRFVGCDNIYWYRNRGNIGPYASVHQVFSRMKTDYFAVQDADDIALPNRLWLSVHALETNNCDFFSACMTNFIEPGSVSVSVHERLSDRPIHVSQPKGVNLTPLGTAINGTLVARRAAFAKLNGFASDWKAGCDSEFATRSRYSDARHFVDSNIVGLRRLHDGSLTNHDDTGAGSEFRNQIHDEWYRRNALYISGVSNLRDFGCLHKADPALTVEVPND